MQRAGQSLIKGDIFCITISFKKKLFDTHLFE